jgi:hypothetical protein
MGSFSQIWLQAKYQSNFLKNILLYFWLLYLSHVKKPENFDQIMAIEKMYMYMILALLIFNIAFWLYTTNRKKNLLSSSLMHRLPFTSSC